MGNTKVKLVPVDDDLGMMLNWAVRYAIGRRTYAVSATCDYIKPLIPNLSDKTLSCIERDIQEHESHGRSFGDDCDLRDWMDLLEAVQFELLNREEAKKQ